METKIIKINRICLIDKLCLCIYEILYSRFIDYFTVDSTELENINVLSKTTFNQDSMTKYIRKYIIELDDTLYAVNIAKTLLITSRINKKLLNDVNKFNTKLKQMKKCDNIDRLLLYTSKFIK